MRCPRYARPTALARLLDCLLGFRRIGGAAVRVVATFFVLIGVLEVVFSRVVLWLAVGVVGFDVDGAQHPVCLFLCMIILVIRRCVVWSFFFMSSVIVHVPEPHGWS